MSTNSRAEPVLPREMCRTVDKLDQLAAAVDREGGVMAPGPGLTQRVYPALTEARQHSTGRGL